MGQHFSSINRSQRHDRNCLLQGKDEGSTADALAALQAEVRCIKHTRALQGVDPNYLGGVDSEGAGADARITQLEGQLAQMEVNSL